jgi:hypothetical protein
MARYMSFVQRCASTGSCDWLYRLPILQLVPCCWLWDIAGAVGNLVSCHHPCGTVNPRRAPTRGFGCHTGCPVITQACTCTTYRALPASRQSSIVPVHKGGAPLPRARGPGCEPVMPHMYCEVINVYGCWFERLGRHVRQTHVTTGNYQFSLSAAVACGLVGMLLHAVVGCSKIAEAEAGVSVPCCCGLCNGKEGARQALMMHQVCAVCFVSWS